MRTERKCNCLSVCCLVAWPFCQLAEAPRVSSTTIGNLCSSLNICFALRRTFATGGGYLVEQGRRSVDDGRVACQHECHRALSGGRQREPGHFRSRLFGRSRLLPIDVVALSVVPWHGVRRRRSSLPDSWCYGGDNADRRCKPYLAQRSPNRG